MFWFRELTSSGMSIGLGKEIPDQIYRYIDSFSAGMLAHTEAESVRFDQCLWAIHPGSAVETGGRKGRTGSERRVEKKRRSGITQLTLSPSLVSSAPFSFSRSVVVPLLLFFPFFSPPPSGPMILTAIGDRLGLSPLHTQSAWTVLRKYGNMSSATLVFVLRELLLQFAEGESGTDNALPPHCSPFIPALAFGPGLNVEGCLLKYVGGSIGNKEGGDDEQQEDS